MNIPIPDADALRTALSLSGRLEFVTHGGFKAVFKRYCAEGAAEALKAVYIPKAKTDDESLQRDQRIARAKREIEALKKCDHPNIVKLGSLQPSETSVGEHDYRT